MTSTYLYECARCYLFDVLNVNHVLWWQILPASDRTGALKIIVISPSAAFSEEYQVRAGSPERQAQMRGESNSWGHCIRHQSNRDWQVVMAVVDSPRDEWKALDRAWLCANADATYCLVLPRPPSFGCLVFFQDVLIERPDGKMLDVCIVLDLNHGESSGWRSYQ